MPVQDPRKAQSSVWSLGALPGPAVCVREFLTYDRVSQEWQRSHAAPQALPLLGCTGPLSSSLPLSPSRVRLLLWMCRGVVLPPTAASATPVVPVLLG